jgi:hypothetical protein
VFYLVATARVGLVGTARPLAGLACQRSAKHKPVRVVAHNGHRPKFRGTDLSAAVVTEGPTASSPLPDRHMIWAPDGQYGGSRSQVVVVDLEFLFGCVGAENSNS